MLITTTVQVMDRAAARDWALHPGSQLWNYIATLRQEGALKPAGSMGPKLGCQFGITPRQMDRLWTIGQAAAAAPQPPASRGKLSQAAKAAWKVGIAESALFADICAAAEHLAQVESHRLGTQVDPLVTEEDMALRRAGVKQDGRMVQPFYSVYVKGKRGEQLLLAAKAAAEGAGAGSAAGAARAQDPGTSAASAILVPDSP